MINTIEFLHESVHFLSDCLWSQTNNQVWEQLCFVASTYDDQTSRQTSIQHFRRTNIPFSVPWNELAKHCNMLRGKLLDCAGTDIGLGFSHWHMQHCQMGTWTELLLKFFSLPRMQGNDMCMGVWGHGYAFKGAGLDRVCKKSTLLDGPTEDAVQYVAEFTVFQPPINYGE